jgi:hypothetical protein
MICPFGVNQPLKLFPVAGANLPNVCGLVRFTVVFGPVNHRASGRRLLRSTRTISLYRSRNATLLESEYCGHHTAPARAISIPALPPVNAAGYENALMLKNGFCRFSGDRFVPTEYFGTLIL